MASQADSGGEAVDAFILFNEREEAVTAIVDELTARDVSTYFWRRDIKAGEDWDRTEREALQSAKTVVVFLGRHGWGPNHLRLAHEAQSLDKRIVPVLVGDPPPDAFKEAGGIFINLRYADLRVMNPAGLDLLVRAIHPGQRTGQFDSLIRRLVDGDEEDRSAVLGQVVDGTITNTAGLADRLRAEIESPSATRDPNLMPSIRSWMLSVLIWADAESPPSRALILKQFDSRSQAERNVRFWALAGLYQRNVSYLDGAIKLCMSDPMPEVQLLAEALLVHAVEEPFRSGLLDRLRSMLLSTSFDEAWPVLRVLRILPILPLAVDLCDLLERHSSDTRPIYDALYALANPPMTREAAPILRNRRGIEWVLDIIFEAMPDSDIGATRNFANLLVAFDAAELEQALREAEARDSRTAASVGVLRTQIQTLGDRPDEALRSFVAGYASDGIDVSRDDLGIREDVQTLTAVMLAKEVVPPLAIGLFGDWGAGKSFFMRSMKAAAKQISDEARRTSRNRFCTDIVSVEFNAWHYADTNLWASLVSHILESLARQVNRPETPEEQEAKLVQQLGSAKEIIAQIEGERETTKKQITARQTDLQTLQVEREKKELELSDLRLSDLRSMLAEDTNLQKELKTALEEVGMPAVFSSVADLTEVVTEVKSLRGRITGLAVGLFKAPKSRWLWLFVAIMLGLPFVAQWFHQYFQESFLLLGTVVGEIAAFISSAVVLLRKAAGYVRDNLEKVEAAKQKVDAAMAERRKRPSPDETKLQEEIASLKAMEDQAASRLRAATEKVIELEQRITALKQSRSLAHFLTERTKSDDYRKHLGVISTIRQDFEALTQQLANPVSDSGLPKVERIILYIDDLDRCPAKKVVEVLEAVHLLLAYPLFIVVVGVDPRWLSYALTSVYPVLKETASPKDVEPHLAQKNWRPTPQNYLEKIFQIPFSLRPMTRTGYGKLVEGLFAASLSGFVPPGMESTSSPPSPPPGYGPGTGFTTPPPSEGTSTPPPGSSSSPSGGATDAPREPEFTIHDESMVIRPVEEAFAKRLFDLLPTPRATKRFSNTYRLLKAPIPRSQLKAFEGSEDALGTFQVPMLLLAILTGMPGEAAKMFPALYDRVKGANEFVDLPPSAILEFASRDLREKISSIVQSDTFPRSPVLFADWLRRVSRFSFEIGRAIKPATSLRN